MWNQIINCKLNSHSLITCYLPTYALRSEKETLSEGANISLDFQEFPCPALSQQSFGEKIILPSPSKAFQVARRLWLYIITITATSDKHFSCYDYCSMSVIWQVTLKARRILIIKETIIQVSRNGSMEKFIRTFGSDIVFFPFLY